MSDGISAAWDDAQHYEQLCIEFNQQIRYSGAGPWPYNMDGRHYEELKAMRRRREEQPAIRLVRPMQIEYMIVGFVLNQWKEYLYKSTEKEFVAKCMTLSHGSMNPDRIKAIHKQLMEEAGL